MREKLKAALIGFPIKYSQSPQLHTQFAKENNLFCQYDLLEIKRDEFSERILKLKRSAGYCGFNITQPYKKAILDFVDEKTADVEAIGACNTIVINNGIWVAHNTDITGWWSDFHQRYLFSLANRRILLLGYGGAGQAILHRLLQDDVTDVCVATRRAQKVPAGVQNIDIKNLQDYSAFDVIIHASSCGHDGSTIIPLGANLLHPDTICYDLNYGAAHLWFADYCNNYHIDNYCDGLGMLTAQAKDSFALWMQMNACY